MIRKSKKWEPQKNHVLGIVVMLLVLSLICNIFWMPREPPDRLSSWIAEQNPRLDTEQSERYAKLIKFYTEKHTVNTRLYAAVIASESHFDCMSLSPMNCVGLAQVRYRYPNKKTKAGKTILGNLVHPEIMKKLGVTCRADLFQIETNLEAGCVILAANLKQEKTLALALKKYIGAQQNLKSWQKYMQKIFRLMAEYEVQ